MLLDLYTWAQILIRCRWLPKNKIRHQCSCKSSTTMWCGPESLSMSPRSRISQNFSLKFSINKFIFQKITQSPGESTLIIIIWWSRTDTINSACMKIQLIDFHHSIKQVIMGLKIHIESLITLELTSLRWIRNQVIPDRLLFLICLLSIKWIMDNFNHKLIRIGTLKLISKLFKQRMEEVSLHKQITLVVSWIWHTQIIPQ